MNKKLINIVNNSIASLHLTSAERAAYLENRYFDPFVYVRPNYTTQYLLIVFRFDVRQLKLGNDKNGYFDCRKP